MKKRKIRFTNVMIIIISIILMICEIARIVLIDHKNSVTTAIDTIESIDKYDSTGKVVTFYSIKQTQISIDGDNISVSLLLEAHELRGSNNGCYVHYAVLNGYDNQVYEDKVWLPIIPDGHTETLQFGIKNIHTINETDYSLIKIKAYSIEEQSE